jgi:hypothetical protein
MIGGVEEPRPASRTARYVEEAARRYFSGRCDGLTAPGRASIARATV